jgi:hypothetical protein
MCDPFTAAIGIGTSVASGMISADASKKAAEQSADAARESAQLQQQRFEESKAMMQPWVAGGQNALGAYSNFLGLNGKDAQSQAMANFQTDPYFQQTLKNTADATTAQYSAHGLTGGNLLDALYKNNAAGWQGQYNNYLQNLAGTSGQGATAGGTVTNAGANAATNQGNFLTQAGNATAAGTMGAGNAWGNALNNASLFAMLGTKSLLPSSND